MSDEWDEKAMPNVPGLGQIAAALARAQAEMSNPGFDSTNPHFKNKFASLAAVRNAVVPVLAKHGISIAQNLTNADKAVGCWTILTHASGQQMVFGPLTLPVSKDDAQGFGSAATYARRYSLMAVACVAGDDDDDANAATGKPAAAESFDEIPIDVARSHATKMLAIIASPEADGDHDGKQKALEALDYHDKHLTGGDKIDLYKAIYRQMETPKRNIWKNLVEKAKDLQKQDRLVDNAGRKF